MGSVPWSKQKSIGSHCFTLMASAGSIPARSSISTMTALRLNYPRVTRQRLNLTYHSTGSKLPSIAMWYGALAIRAASSSMT
jgi:hypothetical protein